MKNRFEVLRSPLFLVAFFLLGLGVVQVHSTSALYAQEQLGSLWVFSQRQFLFALVGVFLMWALSQLQNKWIKSWGWLLWIAASLGVALTLFPGLGIQVGGARRWLPLGMGFRIEPSEFLRLGLVLWLATFFSFRGSRIEKWPWWLLALLSLIPLLLLLRQPDFGSFALIVLSSVLILFSFGLQRRVLVATGLVMIPAMIWLVSKEAYRMNRVTAFLDPWKDPEQKGFQIIQSMLSFSNGGLLGTGLGASQGKLFFLPEAHTDFTLAVFGEEWGFWGFVILVLLYGFLIFRGFQLGLALKETYDRVLAVGLSLVLGLAVLTNMGVVLGLLPTKGLTLPFLSYGGSSLLANCLLVGLLLNLERKLASGRQVKSHFH